MSWRDSALRPSPRFIVTVAMAPSRAMATKSPILVSLMQNSQRGERTPGTAGRKQIRSFVGRNVLHCASRSQSSACKRQFNRSAEPTMVAVICALLSGGAFFLSIGMGEIWWLAWLAPIPVLWLAFGESKLWQVFVAAWAAYALGATNILGPYGGILPLSVLVLSLTVPSFLFAL